MKIRRIILSISIFSLIVLACSPDDPDFIPVEDRDRTEQQATDKAEILEYLNNNYYNSTTLSNLSNPEVSDIVIEGLAEGASVPDGHTLLIDAVETRLTTFEDTEYEYYILKINQGGGEASPFPWTLSPTRLPPPLPCLPLLCARLNPSFGKWR